MTTKIGPQYLSFNKWYPCVSPVLIESYDFWVAQMCQAVIGRIGEHICLARERERSEEWGRGREEEREMWMKRVLLLLCSAHTSNCSNLKQLKRRIRSKTLSIKCWKSIKLTSPTKKLDLRRQIWNLFVSYFWADRI